MLLASVRGTVYCYNSFKASDEDRLPTLFLAMYRLIAEPTLASEQIPPAKSDPALWRTSVTFIGRGSFKAIVHLRPLAIRQRGKDQRPRPSGDGVPVVLAVEHPSLVEMRH